MLIRHYALLLVACLTAPTGSVRVQLVNIPDDGMIVLDDHAIHARDFELPRGTPHHITVVNMNRPGFPGGS